MGVVVALVAVVAGILLGERADPSSAAVALTVGVLGVVGSLFADARTRVAVAASAVALLGFASMSRALDGAAHHSLSSGPAVFDGVLVTDPDSTRFNVEMLVRIESADRIVVARARAEDASRARVLDAGDQVRLEGRLTPLGDDRFDEYFRWRHAVARLEDVRVTSVSPPARGLYAAANTLRDVSTRGMRALDPTSRALLEGFLFGDTRAIPDDITSDYRSAGLSHLLAVSGANVAFALALVAPLLRRLSLPARSATALLTVLVFAATTRFEPSVLRASALAAVGVLSMLAGRPVARLRALVLAVIVLLLVDPFLVHSVGFVLSAAASAGIVLFAHPIHSRLPGPSVVRDALAVSLAAQLGVTPVLLLVFDRVPVVSPITNLLAAPAASALGAFGLPVALLGGRVPTIGTVLHPVNAVLISWVTAVAHVGAQIGLTVDRRGTASAMFVAALATLARRALRVAQAR